MIAAVWLALKGLPAWLYGLLLLVALAAAGMIYERAAGDAAGRAAVQKLWSADKAARAAAETKAVAKRVADNLALAKQQAVTALAITKAHDEEMSTMRARVAAAERLRRPAFCGGPAAAANGPGAGGSAAADPAGGLLPVEVDRDIKALILETEATAATGRACQAFVLANGMGPRN